MVRDIFKVDIKCGVALCSPNQCRGPGILRANKSSPDGNALGLVGTAIDALRYDGHSDDPQEVAGILHAFYAS